MIFNLLNESGKTNSENNVFPQSDDPDWKGYFYTVLIVCVTFVCTLLNSQAFYREYLVGLRIRTALISSIYRKSLRLSNTSRKLMTGLNLHLVKHFQRFLIITSTKTPIIILN